MWLSRKKENSRYMSILDVVMYVYVTAGWSCNVVAEKIDRNLMGISRYVCSRCCDVRIHIDCDVLC